MNEKKETEILGSILFYLYWFLTGKDVKTKDFSSQDFRLTRDSKLGNSRAHSLLRWPLHALMMSHCHLDTSQTRFSLPERSQKMETRSHLIGTDISTTMCQSPFLFLGALRRWRCSYFSWSDKSCQKAICLRQSLLVFTCDVLLV